MYSGINETTIKPVENMVQLAKEDNAWITNLDEVAEYWNKIKTLKINFNENGKKVKMSFNTPNENVIKGLSFKLPTNPKKIKSSEKYSLKNIKGDIFIIFNSIKKGDVVEMEFKD